MDDQTNQSNPNQPVSQPAVPPVVPTPPSAVPEPPAAPPVTPPPAAPPVATTEETGKDLQSLSKDLENLAQEAEKTAPATPATPITPAVEAKPAEAKITIYVTANCPFSKAEKEFLSSQNLQFVEKNVEEDNEALKEMLSLSDNFAGVPVTVLNGPKGKKVVKGFTKEEFIKELEATGLKEPEMQKEPAAPAVPAAPSTPEAPTAEQQPQPPKVPNLQ